jgi:hypothetical protein
LVIKALIVNRIFIQFKEVTREKSRMTGLRRMGWGEDKLAPGNEKHKAQANQEVR